LCRGIGAVIFLGGVLAIVVCVLQPEDRISLAVAGTLMLLLGVAFFIARPITEEHLSADVKDL